MPDRLGRFQVNWDTEHTAALEPLFRSVQVLSKRTVGDRVVEYTARSDAFDEADDTPMYAAVVSVGPDDAVRVRWERV